MAIEKTMEKRSNFAQRNYSSKRSAVGENGHSHLHLYVRLRANSTGKAASLILCRTYANCLIRPQM